MKKKLEIPVTLLPPARPEPRRAVCFIRSDLLPGLGGAGGFGVAPILFPESDRLSGSEGKSAISAIDSDTYYVYFYSMELI